ncbi:MAG: hypothetical protein CO096_25335 [Armatimonadetes bacterium CG_4_9_14_3_um_filter_66_14]|nr:hypothetical protein [Armatimonadota bacterium]PJB62492.1 MAG: hypothetical protein CO096_25335 [Armatimonadetes bacterium CG_4_9_14_3_um_filter_66_14]
MADVQEHVTYEVTSLPASLSADALWMPDSDRLVYCGLGAPWPTVQPYSEVAQPGGAVPPTQLWAQAGERVGALSFAADSLRVAYEDGKLLPGLGVYASRLFVRDLRTDGRQPIPIPDPAETLLLNPQWQPGWSLVAFDSISVDNGNARRKSYVYDTRTRVTRPVVVQGAAYTQVIEWSPDSNSLLVMVDPDYASGEGRCSPYIWYVDPQKSPTPVDGYMSHVYEVHWSPNGERVAFLTGDNCLLSVSRGIDLVIWGAKGGCVHVTLPPGLRPVEFDW